MLELYWQNWRKPSTPNLVYFLVLQKMRCCVRVIRCVSPTNSNFVSAPVLLISQFLFYYCLISFIHLRQLIYHNYKICFPKWLAPTCAVLGWPLWFQQKLLFFNLVEVLTSCIVTGNCNSVALDCKCIY